MSHILTRNFNKKTFPKNQIFKKNFVLRNAKKCVKKFSVKNSPSYRRRCQCSCSMILPSQPEDDQLHRQKKTTQKLIVENTTASTTIETVTLPSAILKTNNLTSQQTTVG